MNKKIPEIEAKEILLNYGGNNNQLLEWKMKFQTVKNYKLIKSQADYVIKYQNISPKVARKHIKIVDTFGEKIREEKMLPKVPEQIWCEKR
jgi:hypothetical protein